MSLKGVEQLEYNTNFLGTNSTELSLETVLPKYDLSAGRGDLGTAHLSMARLYFDYIGEAIDSIEPTPGDQRMLISSGTYVGFLLNSVAERLAEKVQTASLAGDGSHTTFFGASPTQYTFGGVLINGSNVRWREAFSILYKNFLRGSIAVGKGRPVKVVYDNRVVSGWMLNLSQDLSSGNEMVVPFSFTLQVIDEVILTPEKKIADTFVKYSRLGSNGGERGVSSVNTELPMDDYVRKAAIRLPPRAISGGGGAGRCKVKPPVRSKNGEVIKTQAKSGPIESKSPTRSTCDMAEALLYHARLREKYRKKLAEAYKSTKKNAAAERKKYQQLQKKEVEELKKLQKWSLTPGTKGVKEYWKVLQDVDLAHDDPSSQQSTMKLVAAYKGKNPSKSVSKAVRAKKRSKS